MYSDELDTIVRVLKAIEYLVKLMGENPVSYPSAMVAYSAFLYGRPLEGSGNCPYCGKGISIHHDKMIGGVDGSLKYFERAMKELKQEIDYGEE